MKYKKESKGKDPVEGVDAETPGAERQSPENTTLSPSSNDTLSHELQPCQGNFVSHTDRNPSRQLSSDQTNPITHVAQ